MQEKVQTSPQTKNEAVLQKQLSQIMLTSAIKRLYLMDICLEMLPFLAALENSETDDSSSYYSNLYHYAGNNPVKYVDPDGEKNYLVVSCFEGGGDSNVGTTFDDAAATKANDIKKSSNFDSNVDTVTLKKVDSVSQLNDLLNNGNIDSLDMYGHGGEDFLVIGSGKGEGKREQLNKGNLSTLNKHAFNKGATINLYQCNTANEKKIGVLKKLFGAKTIAAQLSDYFGVAVTGNKAGSTAVPSPDAAIDYNFVHERGDPVYYKSAGGTKTYGK